MVAPPPWFLLQLRDTVDFCLPRVRVADPMWCLRSTELTPPGFENAAWVDAWTWIEPNIVQAVVSKRQHAMANAERDRSTDPLRGGRILLCAHRSTNDNGATMDATRYYFDESDVPPWDTWVCEISGADSILVAWVPREFIPTVQLAFEHECMGLLNWADSLQHCWFAHDVPSWLAEFGREPAG